MRRILHQLTQFTSFLPRIFKHFIQFQSFSPLVTLYGGWTKRLTSIQHLLFTFSGYRSEGNIRTFNIRLCCSRNLFFLQFHPESNIILRHVSEGRILSISHHYLTPNGLVHLAGGSKLMD